MCRKLLCLVALLSMVSVATAQVTPIDDFESYWGAPAMVSPLGPWGTGPGNCDDGRGTRAGFLQFFAGSDGCR